jgi:hypothetical protein
MYFTTEIVWRKWYDEASNLFGPVGHTHNGVDAEHSHHNSELMLFPYPYLGSLLEGFERAWYASHLCCD